MKYKLLFIWIKKFWYNNYGYCRWNRSWPSN